MLVRNRALMAGILCLSGAFLLQSSPASAQPQSAVSGGPSAPADPVAIASALPDAPDLALPREQGTSSPQSAPSEGAQTKRILGILPNFRSVSANTHPPPQTPKEKFTAVVQDSFDYSSFVFVGILSGITQIQGSTPEFHTGAPAYARYYWHNFADQTDENLWVGFVLPVALHEDARYFTMGRSGTANRHNNLAKRAGYAFTRILVTRTDSGGSSFNFSEVVGAGASAGVSNLYYPGSDRGWTKTGQRWALNVSIDAVTYVFKEFWPDVNQAIFHTH